MKTYFKAIVAINFGKREHDTGYPGLICHVPELSIPKNEEFSVEFTYNSTSMVRLEYRAIVTMVGIFEMGKYIFQGNVHQIEYLTFPAPTPSMGLWDLD